MKKMIKKVAMILILVMLCNMFTGCGTGGGEALLGFFLIPILAGLAVAVILPALAAVGDSAIDSAKLARRPPRRTNPYQYEKPISALQERERSSFADKIALLPEGELVSIIDAVDSIPEEELNLFIGRLNSMSEEEIVSLIESMNSFSDREFVAILEMLNSMSETEIISSMRELNSLPRTVPLHNIVRNSEVDISGERAYVYQRIQY
ncbi:MAG: hypothetical protein LBI28_11875 [Treponema sp.]|jgi:hypothetical protein|nr:hypothetical protein [Treponema sp.]